MDICIQVQELVNLKKKGFIYVYYVHENLLDSKN